MWKHLARLFVSNTCYGCDNELTIQERCICLDCLSQIEETQFHSTPDTNELYYRLAGRVPLAGASALFYFDKGGRLQKIIQQLKYDSAPQIGTFLGAHYGKILQDTPFIKQSDVILPVPLHFIRHQSRGYNQAERFAKGMAQISGIPVKTNLLQRVRRTKYQAKQLGTARWENVKGAFKVKGSLPERILLLDDVITTGATIGSCLESLYESSTPPKEVRIMCIGMTRQ
ncbi:MAG: ComF family protein [Bacteroidota bacterium]